MKRKSMFPKPKLSHMQVIALGYLIMILAGTCLLMLPVSSRDGLPAGFRTALFTSASSSCVTGLILRDTATGWSAFGQAVILLLIQTGGLGFMTIATMLYMVLHRRMGLKQREIMVESINTTQIGGLMRLTRKIILGTACFEGAGMALLAVRFVPMFGWSRGLWYSLFHAVSAFCNAGFDLMGVLEPCGSLTPFQTDVFVNAVIMALITLGGLGFLVWEDLWKNGHHWKRYRLHTKMVLTVSALLTFGGALILLILERNATGAGMSPGHRCLTALFASVTARTAGFNTVDVAAMSGGSKLFYLLLMLIGGSPGSTAGGVKTTTVTVIALYALASFRGDRKPQVFGRSIREEQLKKSCTVLFFNLSIAFFAALMISAWEPFDIMDILFEAFSAIGTVGVTTGITQGLTALSSYLIALMMFLGRVGSVTFAVAILEKRARPPVTCPEEQVIIG